MSKHDDRDYYGRAVIDGVPQFFSVTGIEKGDIRSGGCLQKWHRRYRLGIKDADSKYTDAGKKMHAEIADYELHPGAPVMLSATAMKGISYIPEPGSDLIVEATLSSPKNPHLFADGIPVIAKMDLVHDRGTNKGAADVDDTIDPPGTIEVIDWKWKGDGKKTEYQLQPEELIKTVQMGGYGVTIGNLWPDRTHVRLSHVYFFERNGRARKVTKLHVIDDCRRSWEYVDTIARTLRDVAREPDPDKVTPNRFACDRFGGCPYRANCRAYAKNVEQLTVSKLFGETAAKDIKMGLQLPPNMVPQQQMQQVAQPQQLPMQQLQQQQVQQVQQLMQEEQQLRAQAAQTAAGTFPGFAEAWAAIERSGRGTPMLSGRAAQLKAALSGYAITPGAGLAGTGELAQINMDDPAMIVQLGNELIANQQQAQQTVQQVQPAMQYVQQPVQQMQPQIMQTGSIVPQVNPQQVGFLPPGAPQSNPALAAKPIEGYTVQQYAQTAQPNVQSAQPNLQPAAQIQLQPQQPVQMVQTAPAEQPAAAPKKRGRRSKAEIEAANAEIEAANAAAAAAQPAGASVTAPAITQPVTQSEQNETAFDADSAVYVNCIPNGDFESLHPYIDTICELLVQRFNTAPDALKDVRTAPKDGPLGFGGWRGGIRAIVLEYPPPGGNLYIDARGDELATEVANALRTVCERTGALYVKGI